MKFNTSPQDTRANHKKFSEKINITIPTNFLGKFTKFPKYNSNLKNTIAKRGGNPQN